MTLVLYVQNVKIHKIEDFTTVSQNVGSYSKISANGFAQVTFILVQPPLPPKKNISCLPLTGDKQVFTGYKYRLEGSHM